MKIAEFITKNQTLIIAAGGTLLAYIIYKKISATSLGGKIGTLGQGLQNPIDALGAFVTGGAVLPTPQGTGAQLTDNLNWYIKYYYGTVENYLAQQKAGTANKPAYDRFVDYKKLYSQNSIFNKIFN